jgi:hypothetical protein
MNKVTHTIEDDTVTISINGISHLIFKKQSVDFIQSFVSTSGEWYCLEIYRVGKPFPVLCEYKDKQLWKDIIAVFDEIIQ